MVVLGLLLIALGILAVVAAVFDLESVPVELLGTELDSLYVFLLGVGAGLSVLWGFAILKFGTRRTLQRRREAKQLNELSQKLDQVEAERRRDGEGEEKPS